MFYNIMSRKQKGSDIPTYYMSSQSKIHANGTELALKKKSRSNTRRCVNLSAILLRSLKVERCNFPWKNRPGDGASQKLASTPVRLLRGTVNIEHEIFKMARNTTSEAKERPYTAGKVIL